MPNTPQNFQALLSLLDSVRTQATDEYGDSDITKQHAKGKFFEHLTLLFLQNDKTYSAQYKSVYTYKQWATKQGLPANDTGIDLVAETDDGGTVAVQCKFYRGDNKIQRRHLDSFIAASGVEPFTHRLFVDSTLGDLGRNADAILENQQIPFTRLTITEMANGSVDWSEYHSDTGTIKHIPKKTLHDHQKTAVNIGNAEQKLTTLESILKDFPDSKKKHCLFYSGIGKPIAFNENDNTDTDERQIEKITKKLHELHWTCSRYTSDERLDQRESSLEKFALGDLDALVAMKCLDEGVDIPACRTAFITASSNDPREFVQRRGRILRKYDDKEYAEIHDLVVNNPEQGKSIDGIPTLIRRELARVYEFAHLALNEDECREKMQSICDYQGVEWGEDCSIDFTDMDSSSYSEE